MRRILVTGAIGQIGSELTPALQQRYGSDNVVASDVRMPASVGAVHNGEAASDPGLFEHVDCTRPHLLHETVRRYEIGTIYHLAALLSAAAEEKPQIAWAVNMGGLYNVLEVARQYGCSVFFPSSIGAFGPSTPRDSTPQVTVQRPTTMYGVTKVAGEIMCDYYATRFGVDTRGLRLPGLISHVAPPGGGTTDYAVEIFRQAARYRHYTCYLRADTRLDMMYMPDAVRAMLELMPADPTQLVNRNAYNITAMNVTPEEIAAAIAERIPGFVIDYDIDPIRQAIADSWPRSVDDSVARVEWNWAPQYDLGGMCEDMLLQFRRVPKKTGAD
ncbi:MAG: NAD-dependent epimerase/dehydratase family protein [Hyphomicrobiaceae bacterium]